VGEGQGEGGMAIPCYDGNGNVTALLDDNGTVTARYEYTPFGQLFASSGPAAHDNPWRFSTKPYDDLWNLVFYEYRVYSPDLQIWLSRDPLGEQDGALLYLFVVNSPVQYFDAYGLITAREAESKCQQYITASTGGGGWKEIPGGTITISDKQDCRKQIDDLLQNSKLIARLWEQFDNVPNNTKCVRPQFDCVCCSKWIRGEETIIEMGGYNRNHNDPFIKICWNNVNKLDFANTLAHEITHRLQQCTASDPNDPSCEGSLKREIEARICAYQCKGFDDCLLKALVSSCSARSYCKKSTDVSNAFDAIKKWYQDKAQKGAGNGGFCSFYPKLPAPSLP